MIINNVLIIGYYNQNLMNFNLHFNVINGMEIIDQWNFRLILKK